MLAWAMSIHKSQGQTIEHVKIDLRSVFEKGQSYVALLRAASLKELHVLSFYPKRVHVLRVGRVLSGTKLTRSVLVKAHPKVIEWSSSLEVAAAPTPHVDERIT